MNEDILLEEMLSFRHHALAVDKTIKMAPEATLLRIIFKHGFEEGYPNLTAALKILFTLSVTVASGEGTVRKLEIVKKYLRTTMGQDRLTNSSIICIENDRVLSTTYSLR